MKPESVFFITGAANGIGRATSELVVTQGHRVVICDVDAPGAAELAGRLGDAAYPLRLDVRSESDWAEALDLSWKRFSGVDVVINNAGLVHNGFVRDQSDEQIRHMVEVNYLALITACRMTVPRLIAQGHGHVINIGSLAGFVPLKGQAVYCGTKHAVRAFHHALAAEHVDDPIDFSLVCPAAVNTGMLQQQIGHTSAALSFADESLSPGEVAQGIYHAAEHRPTEVLLPSVRGELIRLLGIYPRAVRSITAVSERKGLRTMERMKGADPTESDQRYTRG